MLKKYLLFFASAILFFTNSFSQNVTVEIDGDNLYYWESSCADCNGNPDPRWRARVYSPSGPYDWNVDRDEVCGWSNNTNYNWVAPQTQASTSTITMQLHGWESDGLFCGGDDYNCGGYATVGSAQINAYPPCQWNYFNHGRWCGGGGYYEIRWSYYWYYQSINSGSINGTQTICYGGDPTLLGNASSGSAWVNYYWQYSDNSGGTWTTIGGATSDTYDPPSGLTNTRWYRRVASTCGGAADAATTHIVVTVLPALNYGTVNSGNETICNGGNPANITLSVAPTGSGSFSYQWYYQDGIVSCPSGSSTAGWTSIGGANGSSYDPPSGLTGSRTYALMVIPGASPTCGTSTWATQCRQVTVLPAMNYGTLTSGNETICNGGNPANITFSVAPVGSTSFTYQWYYQDGIVSCPSGTSTAGWTAIGGATGSSYDPPAGLTGSRTYAVIVIPGGSPTCGTSTWASQCRQVTVLPAVNYGTLTSGNETICNGGNPANITFSTAPVGSGSFTYQWYYQDGLVACPTGTTNGGWTSIGGANGSSYDPPTGLTGSRTYAVMVIPGGSPSCGTTTWASQCRQVTVLPVVNYGTLTSGNQTICNGGDPANITFSTAPVGSTSFTYQWYYQDGIVACPSGTSTAGWNPIGGATGSNYDPPSGLTVSRTYAVVVIPGGSPTCGTATWATQCRQITVLPAIDYGTLTSGNETICNGGDPSVISFSTAPVGSTSFTYQWYYQDGLVACPTGSSTAGWTIIGGATGPSYDPTTGLTVSRTYAVIVTPTGSPTCGTATWANSCRQVTVLPVVNYGTLTSANETICNGGNPSNITFATAPVGSGSFNYQWYYQDGIVACPSGTSNGGWTSIGGANSSSYDPPSGLTGSRTYAVMVTPAGSPTCGTTTWATQCRQVTVLPVVNYGTLTSGNQTLCNGGDPANITFSITPVGSGSFTYQWYYQDGIISCPSGSSTAGWTAIGGATGSSYDPPSGLTVSRTYAVMVIPGGSPSCGTATWATQCRQITVLPAVNYGTLTSGNETLCNGGDPSNITFSVTPVGSTSFTYQWYYQDGIVACPSGSAISGWTVIGGATGTSYDPPSGLTGSRTYVVMVTPGGSPSCGTATWATQCRQVTVLPVVNYGTLASGNESACVTINPSNIIFSIAPVGSGSFSYQWYYQDGLVSCPSGSSTAGWTSIGGATSSSYDPPAGLTVSRTYAVMVIPSGSPTCGTATWATQCRQVTINPLPTVSFSGLSGPYCANAANVPLTGSPAGGTFSGTGVSGTTFFPAIALIGSNSVTYTYTDGNGCTNSQTQTVQVNGLPSVSFTGFSGTYCVSQSTPVLLTGNQTTGTFSGSGITNLGSGTANFTPSVAGAGVHNITFTYTDGNGCTNSQTQSVQVIDLPLVSISGLAASYCVTNAPVQLTGFPAGGTFSGTPAVTSGGLFSPSAGIGNYTITYTYTNGNGCTNSISASTVVNALPVVSFSGFANPAQYCQNAAVVNLVGSPTGGTFSGQGVTSGGVFTPSTAGLGTHVITYSYSDGNGCSNTSTQSVTVVAVPTVSFTGLVSDYCVNDSPVLLTGNQGTNGTFSGPGITNNGNGTATFSPTLAGIGGSYGITFSYTDANGCSGSQTQQTVVHPQPVVAFSGLNAAYCVDAASATLTGSHAPGGTFSGTGITDNGNGTATFNPAAAGVGGLYAITYSYTDVFGCSSSISANTLVNDTPSVSFTGLHDICIDQPALILTGVPPGGIFSGNGVSGNAFYPSLAGLGVQTVTYYYNDGNGCDASYSDSLRVYDIPQITVQPNDVQVCPGDAATFGVTAFGVGISYQWFVNDGNGFVVLNNGGIYSGATTNTLSISAVPPTLDGYQFNCVVTGATCLTSTTSNTVTIIENPSPTINTQPVDFAACAGDNAVFSVNASGTSLTYQWQVNTGGGWVNVTNGGVYSGATTNTLTVTGFTIGMDGYLYQCVVTGTINCTSNSISNPAMLDVTTSPNIVTQPVTQNICEGDNAVFALAAQGSGLSYQWQENTGSGFVNVTNGGAYSGATSATLTVAGVTAAMDGYQYQCIVSGSFCANTSASNTVLINITTSPYISQQPVDAYVCPSDPASFSVTVQGTGITYQWQVNNGSGWVNVTNTGVYSGATTAALSISSVLANMDSYEYRCIVNGTFCSGTSISLVGIIHINGAPVITQQPSDMNYCVGDNAAFTVNASGTGLTYQWQVNNGSGWVDLVNGINYSGVNNSTLNILAAPLSFDGNLYRVVVSGSINCSGSTTSNAALFNEDPNPFISSQPVDQYICTGDNTAFSVIVSGSGLTYQWQVNTGGGFVNVTNGGVYSGATTSTLNITGVISGMDGYTYQCIINGSICTGTSITNTVTLHETTSPYISVQPQDQSVCIGDNVVMSTTANGSGLTYQWQVNTGSGFVNVINGGVYSGSTTSSLLISGATLGMNNYQYQVIINGTSCPNASTSNAVTLYVGQSPMIVTNPVTMAVCDGFDASFSVTTLGNNLTYQWQVNTGSGFTNINNGGVYSNATTSTLNITGAGVSMTGYQYQVIVTGSINCALTSTSSSAVLTVNPLPVVSISGLLTQYCVNAPDVVLTGVPASGTFSGTGVSGTTFSPSTAGVGGPYPVLYEYTDGNGCYNSATINVTVVAQPVVSFSGLSGTYCINDNTPVALTGSPSGGTFSGTGITGNTFVPSIAQLGNNSITYTYTNLNGCVNSQTQVAVVNNIPVVSFSGLNLEYCEDNSTPVTLTGNNAPNGTFTASGGGLTDNGNGTASFVASVAGAGTHTITYTFTDGNGCTNSQTQSVLVNTLPAITFSGLATQYCVTNTAATLTGFPTGGTFSGVGVSGNTFDPAVAGLGSHTVTYSYTNPSTGCSNTTTQTTIVYAQPVANAGTGGDVCGLTFSLAATPSVGTGTWTATGPGTASYSPNANTANATATVSTFGTYTFTWTEDNNGCTSAASVTVNFYDQPVVSAGTGGSECDLDFTFNGSANVGTGAWTSSGPGTAFYTNNSSPTASVMVSASGIYTFTYTVTNGTCTASDQVTVNFNVLPVANAGQDGSECDLDFVFNASPTVGTGTWTQVSGPGTSTFSPNANDPAATVTVTASGTYVFDWTENHNGCVSSDNISVVFHALPVVTISSLDPAYCVNDNSVINMTGSPAGGIFSGPGVSGTVFNPSVAGVGTHTIVYDYTDNFGCSNSHSQQVQVYGLTTTTIVSLGSDYCADDSSPVSISGTPSGGVFTGPGISGNTFTPSVAGTGTHTITYTAGDGNGCSNFTTQTVTVNALPVVSFTGLAPEYCADAASVTLTPNPSGATFSGPGISGNTFSPSTAGAGTHTIICTFTDGNGCTNTTSQTVIVRALPVVTVNPSGTASFCQGGSVLVSASNGFASYNWSNGNNNQSFLANQTGQYTVDVTDVWGCTATSSPVNVVVNQLPVVNLGNDTTICTGNSVTLDAGNFVSYVWSPGGATTALLTASNNGAYMVTVTDANGCVGSDQVSVTVAALLQPTVTSSGNTNTFCVGGSLVLDAGPGYASYQWSDGITTTQTMTATQSGFFSVMVTDNSGCTGTSAPVSITTIPGPTPVIIADGPLAFCEGNSVTLHAGIGYAEYLWSPNSQITEAITVSQAGTYSVTVEDANGCTGSTVPVQVTVYPIPNPVLQADGPLQFCHGDDVILSVQGSYASYLWSSGSTTPEIVVLETGQYGVIVMDMNGCIDSSLVVNPVTVTVWNPLAFIVESGDSLTCTPAFSGYQWYFNGTLIPGANSQVHVAQVSGNYSVVVTDDHGCTGGSNIIEHSMVGIEDVGLNANISIYPNPTRGVFSFNAEFDGYENLRIELTNALGQLIIPVEDVRDVIIVKRDYNLNHLPNGVYVLMIRTDKGNVAKRIVKN